MQCFDSEFAFDLLDKSQAEKTETLLRFISVFRYQAFDNYVTFT
jgi:hypothetical protein